MHTLVATVTAAAATPLEVAELVAYLIAFVLLAILVVLYLNIIRTSRSVAKEMGLPQGQWLRPVYTLAFDPILYVLIIGVVLGADLVQNWEHMAVGVAGAAVGVWVGHFRYRIQYVRAVPERKSIVFVRSRTEYVAAFILVLVDYAAEQHRVPVVGALTLLITALLSLIVFESIGRTSFCYSRYRKDTAATQPAATSV